MSLITVGARICWLLVLLPSPVWAGTLWPMTLLERSWECDLSHHTCCWVKLYLKGCGPWLCPHSIPEGLRPLVVRFRQVPFSILYWRCSLSHWSLQETCSALTTLQQPLLLHCGWKEGSEVYNYQESNWDEPGKGPHHFGIPQIMVGVPVSFSPSSRTQAWGRCKQTKAESWDSSRTFFPLSSLDNCPLIEGEWEARH